MLSRRVRLLACALTGALALSVVPAEASNQSRARTATRYLARHQEDNGSIVAFSEYGSTADAVIALVAARRGKRQIDAALGFLARRVRNGKVFDDPDVGVLGKIVMAAEAAGRNARKFGGRNLVRRIANLERPSGRLGRGTEVFSHGLLMLGLRAADKDVPRKVSRWLANAQCADGGWAFDNPPGPNDAEDCDDPGDVGDFPSDSNTTAVTIMALKATRWPLNEGAFLFLEGVRDSEHGGWGYSPAFPPVTTDANSTALVIQAHLAAKVPLPARAMTALKGLQVTLCGANAGAFRFVYGDENPPDLGATISAPPALMKKPLPLKPFKVTKPVPRRQPCG
jgi:hypothetical protein